MKYYTVVIKYDNGEFRKITLNEDDSSAIKDAIKSGAERIDMGDNGFVLQSQIKDIYFDKEISKDINIVNNNQENRISEPSQEKQREHIQEYLKNNKEKLYKKMGWGL